MPNVLLTQRCVRSCPYCFAKKQMADAAPDEVLSWENLVYLADFLERSGERRISLLGGEPMLHPDFDDVVVYLLARGFDVVVFTSGIAAPEALHRTHAALRGAADRVSFVCNLNEPRFSPPGEVAQVERFLDLFGPRVAPGFNIYRPDFDLGFLLDHVNRFGLRRSLRLGLAHPIPGTRNLHVRLDQLDAAMERLMSFREVFERLRVGMGPDCGFPLCAFKDEHLGWLYRATGGAFGFTCGPAIDIGPDMSVWACFPLSQHHRRSIFEFDSLADVHRYYEDRFRTLRTEMGGILPACDDCRHREQGVCSGGCAAHILAAFQGEERVRLPEVYA